MISPAIKIPAKAANKIHKILLKMELLKKGPKPIREKETVYFPLTKTPAQNQKTLLKKFSRQITFPKKNFTAPKTKPRNLKSALKGKLTSKQMAHLKRAFDTIGQIAVIEIPPELEKKQSLIANALLEVNKNIQSVYKKSGAHKGEFRVLPVKYLAGKKSKKTTYKEAGCAFELELGKTFFSPRLSTERMRISKLIKNGETVGALFAGVGPFPIVFAKNSKMKKAYSVELNPSSYSFMLRNIALNKVGKKVIPVLGDVRAAKHFLEGKCDRVVMPLPKGGETFLKDSIQCIKPKGGTVHFYQFTSLKNPYTEPLKTIREAASTLKRKVRILRKHKVRSYSPDTIQIVVDFHVK